jgi:glycosyltransferase involved in cell wall biosynthesis
MYNSKLLSIITVSRYYDEELFKTIKSVDNEFLSFIINGEIEHIIVCSEEVEYTNEAKRKYIYTPPKGIYNAMNVGLHNAIGEWLWFLNAGDETKTGISGKLLNYFNLYSNVDIIIAGISIVKDGQCFDSFGRKFPPHQSTFYKNKVLSRIGGYREDFRGISDVIVFDRLDNKKSSKCKVNLIVANYYWNGFSSSVKGKKIIRKEFFRYAILKPYSPLRWYRYFKNVYNYWKCVYENQYKS